MTYPTQTPSPEPTPIDRPDHPGAGVDRPDAGETPQPGQTRTPPATGGEGAAGAGGPDGFGTGS